jgi:DNA-binding MarR family transcriptional regulator
MMDQSTRIRALIDRLARLEARDHWADELNPAQWTALDYLARANRFSRSPSQVADYLGATRGTVSQTLRALARKGHVSEERSETDKRSISYSLTENGLGVADGQTGLAAAVDRLDRHSMSELASRLEMLLRQAIAVNGGRSFGLCRTCRFHETKGTGGFCRLLDLPLARDEIEKICYEHEAET